MSNEYENLAKIILATPQGTKIISTIEKFSAFAATKEGEELITLVATGGADAIKNSAVAALNGEGDKAKTIITTLLSSQEGATLAAKIIEILR